MSKKKAGIIAAVVIVIAAAAGILWYILGGGGIGGSSGDKVYVEAVSSLNGVNSGVQNRYSGKIEPQQTWEINKNSDKTVKEIFVKEGDEVEEGTPLFEYNTEEIKQQIAQAELELEGIDNDISDYKGQISALEEERSTVSEDEKFQYTTQIQTIQTTIKQSEYSKESKKVEIENLQASVDNAVVASEIAGIVKSISESGYDQNTGEELAFMTVLATGDYRVKGTINEQNVWTLTEGQPVIIRSRIDETQTWAGSISEIDTKNEVTSTNSAYYDESSGSETATKYPFYIALETVEGLLLGQHVLIELDNGQEEEKEGVWIYESYLVMEEDSTFVWADNGNGKLEKRTVELGEYDEGTAAYEILSGLTKEDYIAYPMEALYEGVATVTDASEVDYSSPMYQEEGLEEGGDGTEVLDESIDAVDGSLEDGGGGTEEGQDGEVGESLDIQETEPEVSE